MKKVILILAILLCSCAGSSEIKLSNSKVLITAFTDEEIAKGEPTEWWSHHGICRKIPRRIMPSIVKIKEGLLPQDTYALHVKTDDNGVVLLKTINIKAEDYPMLSWRWNISNIIPESREKEVGKDDYPAALCIAYAKRFLGIPYHIRGIIYVWASNIPTGESYTNPCDERWRVIAIRSGSDGVGQWVDHTVNHYDDYIKEHGGRPDKIFLVGIQTNTDRNHGKVETYYTNIALSSH